MKKQLIVVGLVAFLFSPLLASASTFFGGMQYNLPSNQGASENLYAVGQSVNVAGAVTGDMFSAGANIFVTGNFGEDISVAGGNVTLSKGSGGDVRVAGGTLTLSGPVGGDLVAAGGNINVLSGTEIEGDVLLAGGNLDIQAAVNGSAKMFAGTVYVDGTFAKDLVVRADEVKLGPNAVIKGTFEYTSPKEAVIDPAAKVGSVNFHKAEKPASSERSAKGAFAFFSAWWLMKLIATISAALIFSAIWKGRIGSAVMEAADNFWNEFGRGLIIAIAMPIISVIAIFTLIGTIPGIFALLIFGALLVFSSVLAGILSGVFLARWFKYPHRALHWGTTVIGVVVFSLVSLVPFIGWMIHSVVCLAALGVVSKRLWNRSRAD
jgi:cytoskeletal protein CcmA (bactofilin family)